MRGERVKVGDDRWVLAQLVLEPIHGVCMSLLVAVKTHRAFHGLPVELAKT